MGKKYQLPKEFAEKWVKALRSNKYKQHSGELRNNIIKNCYCAIGIACIANGIEIDSTGFYPVKDGKTLDYYGGYIYMTESMVKEIVSLNDHQKTPFPQIADWIEANVEFV